MEDYEKKYKEALSRAATELETCGADKSLRNMIYAIFPDELKESEDERIRNALIRFHKSTIDVDGIKGEEIITWLEKQGSQQPTIIWHSVSEEPEEMKELFCEWESDDATWHDVAFYDEESKTFRHAKMPINVTKWVYVDELLERQGKQKPFDYESATITQKEDEKIRKALVDALNKNLGNGIEKYGTTLNAALTWLEKQGKKSAAWSDEDEKMYKIALSCIETLEDISNGKNMHADVKEWLKRLKDRIGG